VAVDIFVNYQDWLDQQTMPKGQKAALVAAMTLFAERGFDGTATSDIAKQAGISQATIFKYYHTKQDLLVAVVKPVMSHFFPKYRDQFFAGLASCSTLEAMVHFIVTDRYHFIMANLEAVKIIVVELLTSSDIRQLLKALLLTDDTDFLAKLLELFRRMPALRADINAVDLLRIIAGQLICYIVQAHYVPGLLQGEQQDLSKLVAQIVREISQVELPDSEPV